MSYPSNRPTHKELRKKLAQAIQALDAGQYVIVDRERHFLPDMDSLESLDQTEHFTQIRTFLQEIQEAGGPECYVGKRPPYFSYHPGYENVELFAFVWQSPSTSKDLYLKFGICLNGDALPPTYVYLNCHEDEPSKKNR